MNTSKRASETGLPSGLRGQLLDFRRRVWTSKSAEAVAIAVCSVLFAWLAVFLLDRFLETPAWLRGGALALVVVGLALIPAGLYRWVWCRRTMPQVARLIYKNLPGPGDRLLGVLELVGDRVEQERSPVLCQAAIAQVADDAKSWDLVQGLPRSRNRTWWLQVVVLTGLMAVASVLAPSAIKNAWARMTAPWSDTPRYTFASLNQLPGELIVPHGEPHHFQIALNEHSRWQPAQAKLTVGVQSPIAASLDQNRYRFEIPPQVDAAPVKVRVGDARHALEIKPTLRPELTSVMARVELPEYLQRSESIEQDLRGGVAKLVRGSQVALLAEANRSLQDASINGTACAPNGTTFSRVGIAIEESAQWQLDWQDELGLAGKEPFQITMTAHEDGEPSISASGLRRQQVVLVSEQLTFQIQSQDDFGIKEVGLQWQGFQYDGKPSKSKGRTVLAAGGPNRETLNATGTFQAETLGIAPQAVEVRLYATDYLPHREPKLSPPFMLYVLSADEHAIWVTEQLSLWHRRALEVRDKELRLHAKNKSIRALSPEELGTPETRQQIERQAAAEKSNGRRLANLSEAGEQIIQMAMRNPEFGVGHLEKWAEMLQILKEISANRMPSVADLLKDAAEAPQVAKNSPPSAPSAGMDRGPTGKPLSDDEPAPGAASEPPVPSLVDRESSLGSSADELAANEEEKKSSSGRLTLPVTTLTGKAKKGEACSTEGAMEDAVEEQIDLLAEFEKVANELNNILANLEGSTLIKRLKAESRKQIELSGSLADLMESSFGLLKLTNAGKTTEEFAPIMTGEKRAAKSISYIMDDMQAYFERRPFAQFKTVLQEMRETDVLGSLRKLEVDIPRESGISMAQCDYWADTMDRWAEDLVDPAGGGT
jgi:hypothetical protein